MKRTSLSTLMMLALLLLSACTSSPTTGYIPVSGNGIIYYEEMGNGPTVILLHGHSLDTRMWDTQFAGG